MYLVTLQHNHHRLIFFFVVYNPFRNENTNMLKDTVDEEKEIECVLYIHVTWCHLFMHMMKAVWQKDMVFSPPIHKSRASLGNNPFLSCTLFFVSLSYQLWVDRVFQDQPQSKRSYRMLGQLFSRLVCRWYQALLPSNEWFLHQR